MAEHGAGNVVADGSGDAAPRVHVLARFTSSTKETYADPDDDDDGVGVNLDKGTEAPEEGDDGDFDCDEGSVGDCDDVDDGGSETAGKRSRIDLQPCSEFCFGSERMADYREMSLEWNLSQRKEQAQAAIRSALSFQETRGHADVDVDEVDTRKHGKYTLRIQPRVGTRPVECCIDCFCWAMNLPRRTFSKYSQEEKLLTAGTAQQRQRMAQMRGKSVKTPGRPTSIKEAVKRHLENKTLCLYTKEDVRKQVRKLDDVTHDKAWVFFRNLFDNACAQPNADKRILKGYPTKKDVYKSYWQYCMGVKPKEDPSSDLCYDELCHLVGDKELPCAAGDKCRFRHNTKTMDFADIRRWLVCHKPPTRNYFKRSAFFQYWDNVWPDLVIQFARAVDSKCAACEALGFQRARIGQDPTSAEAKHLANCEEHHRIGHSRERAVYHDARLDESWLCVIGDGMTQNKTNLPRVAEHAGSLKAVGTKMQGTITHGKERAVCRVWPHIRSGANVAIHALALAIDAELLAVERNQQSGDGTRLLKRKLWVQADGGPENANSDFYAFCEWLAKHMFEEVVVFRLPVGHTHEDIDAMFGELWNATRLSYIMTPAEQESAFTEVLKQGEQGNGCARFEDVRIVPDYKRWLSGKVTKRRRGEEEDA